MYKIRITPLRDVQQKDFVKVMKEALRKHAERCFLVREYGNENGSLHFQGWVVPKEKGDDKKVHKNFSQNVRNSLDGLIAARQEGMTCGKCYDDNYKYYCCKGPHGVRGELPDVVLSIGELGTVDNIFNLVEWHNRYHDHLDHMKKLPKVTKKSFHDELFERVMKLSGDCDRGDVVDVYIKLCVEQRRPLDVYRARAWVNTYWCMRSSENIAFVRNAIVEKV